MTVGEIRIETLIDSMVQLMELYRREEEVIAARDREGLNALATEKARLARAQEEAMRTVAREPELLRGMSAEVAERLHSTVGAFQAASLANAETVRVAIGASETVARTIVNAMTTARAQDDPTASFAPPGYGRHRPPVSGSFNQVL